MEVSDDGVCVVPKANRPLSDVSSANALDYVPTEMVELALYLHDLKSRRSFRTAETAAVLHG